MRLFSIDRVIQEDDYMYIVETYNKHIVDAPAQSRDGSLVVNISKYTCDAYVLPKMA
jgi:hypothetical protein